MTVHLTIQRQAWMAHVADTVAAYGAGLVPVVKGNGYGVGRALLQGVVADLFGSAATVAVGTVHELHDVPPSLAPVVLTPTLSAPTDDHPILTVAAPEHLRALAGWHGRVVVKLASTMRRFGVAPDALPGTLAAAKAQGLEVVALGVHLPLAGDDAARLYEIRAWLPHLPPDLPLWVSHLSAASFRRLRTEVSDRDVRIRVGTALWHGVQRGDFLRLTTDVLGVTPVRGGDRVGYHASIAPSDGSVVTLGAGTASGIAPLDTNDPARRSPFHFARRRLALVEGPHMHASLVFVPGGEPCPAVGDEVDVQRPLVTTNADDVRWR
jgi:alanine racemase